MRLDFVGVHPFSARGRSAGLTGLRGALAMALALMGLAGAQVSVAPPARAEAQAPDGELLKVVILSRHGVRSPLADPPAIGAHRPGRSGPAAAGSAARAS